MEIYHNKQILTKMLDGTGKQINPFTGMEVWTIPGRNRKPIYNSIKIEPKPVDSKKIENYCNFCATNYKNTPPEKARLVKMKHGSSYELCLHAKTSRIFSELADFRRIPNLFEIVTFDYWRRNYDYKLSDSNNIWKSQYLSTKEGKEHVLNVVDLKLKISGVTSVSEEKKIFMSDAFFGGGHELIVANRHFNTKAKTTIDLCSSGELTSLEHFNYFSFTIKAMKDIYEQNRYIRYISVFQNWLKDAGASFDHLHKQLVALDEWGASVEKELELAKHNSNMYNELAANFAIYNNLVLAENNYAIAFVDIGHMYPSIAIYSKSNHLRPEEHNKTELKGISDVVHAIHAATKNSIACNEEWYYTPRDSIIPMPWHILIKWRVNTPAGFEGGTKIFINPIAPIDFRDIIVPRLYDLKEENRIDQNVKIYDESPMRVNCLKYGGKI